MKKSALFCLVGLSLALGGCGDDSGGRDSDSDSNSVTGIPTGETTASSSDSDSNSGSTDSDSASTDSDSDSASTDSDSNSTNASTGDDGPNFDLQEIPDSAFNCGAGGGGDDPEFSFLWAANSSQGTITKIDTKTVTEVGRYIVRPDGSGSPSRTSVSLSGHVAVASRSGGVTKIYANEDQCEESNGMPGIQTSTNNQALPWGTEECIAWHTPMQYASQRPVAWGAGEFNEGTCQWENEEVWTAATQGQTIDVYVLDGDDGSTKEMITLDGVAASYYGIYGAAVDGNGDFWGSQLGTNKLVRVNREDMTYDVWPMATSGYGMTVDSDGYVWTCSSNVARFDPESETWEVANVGGYTGCMADAAEGGLLWVSNGSGVIGVDRETLQVQQTWNAGGSYGVSIDFEGYIWTVANGSTASKIDPETGEFWTYNGLVGAYTYSDMTGYALTNVGTPSG